MRTGRLTASQASRGERARASSRTPNRPLRRSVRATTASAHRRRSCTSAATSAARSASAPTSTYSPSPCAWSPTAPRPSSTADAEAGEHVAVGAASDRRLLERRQPEPGGERPCARRRARPRRGARAAGSRRSAPTVSDVPGVTGRSPAKPRRDAVCLGDSCATGRRRATAASAGTVFAAVPAVTSVGVTVVPSSGRASAATASSWWASSTAAFAPSAGSRPGVRGPAAHLEPVDARRPCAPSSARRQRSARARAPPRCPAARLLDQRDARWASRVSSSVVSRTATPSSDSSTESAKRSCTTPAFMSKTPGPVARPVAHLERPPGERPERPDRVQVADQQHAGRRAETASGDAHARRTRSRSTLPPSSSAARPAATSAQARHAPSSADGDSASTSLRSASTMSGVRALRSRRSCCCSAISTTILSARAGRDVRW